VKICYQPQNFRDEALAAIRRAVEILESYAQRGYDLTLRQLYYQFVARGWIPNKDSEYKRLGEIISAGRMAGLIDWAHIVDRTRNLRSLAHWDSPEGIVAACARQFRLDKWAEQPECVEVWVEKDALIGVLQVACEPLDVAYFSCRGYTSQSEMWSAAMRLLKRLDEGKRVTVLHFGDHDPSGIDMTRDIEDRLSLFIRHHDGLALERFQVRRVALNMDQVAAYAPPPNPAKVTDSRARDYIERYGSESWELDALPPEAITELIRGAVGELRSAPLWEQARQSEEQGREDLTLVAASWAEAADLLRGPA
jgi:hypothetical protein